MDHVGSLICREVANFYKGKNVDKGVAFPTCVSVNRCVADCVCGCMYRMLLSIQSCTLHAHQHAPPAHDPCPHVPSPHDFRLGGVSPANPPPTPPCGMISEPPIPPSMCACSVVGHFSPSVEDTTTLKDGDIVKM